MSSFFTCALLPLLFYCYSFSPANCLIDPVHFKYLNFTTVGAEVEMNPKNVCSYCVTPCYADGQMMEEHAFTNAALGQYIHDEFSAAKVDIHSALGKEWVNEFHITSMPAFLMVDEGGYLLHRLETACSGTSLLAALSTRFAAATTMTRPDTVPEGSVILVSKHLVAEQGSVEPLSDSLKHEEVASSHAENEIIVTTMIPVEGRDQSDKTAIEEIIPIKKLLIQGTYKLQLGQFTDYNKAADLAKQIQSHFHKEVILKIDAKGHYRTYSLLVQGFADRQEADYFLKDLGKLDLVW
jgi:SPOR domain